MRPGRIRSLILFIFLIVLLAYRSAFGRILNDWRDSDAYKPNPILFLHGFASGKYQSWDKIVVYGIEDIKGLRNYFYKYTQVTLSYPYLERISFNDPNGSIDTYPPGKFNLDGNSKGWADKINDKINLLLPIYKFKGGISLKYILICHSMGGLAAREYVTNPKYSHADANIDKIITIGTPHAGTSIASVRKIESAIAGDGKYVWEVPYYGKTKAIRSFDESNAIIMYVRGRYKIDFEGEAIRDMAVDSSFLITLGAKPFPNNIKRFAIYGEAKSEIFRQLNAWFFYLYYPSEPRTCGDGIVPRDSQKGYDIMTEYPTRAYWVWQPDKIERVQADHITELESKETLQKLLQLLDSTPPELEITSPDPHKITEITQTSIHITGKVYKEYLPADSQLIITITKQGNGSIPLPQSSFLKASDLWIPNNPDLPVAEFDEVVNFPGNGTFEVSCQVKNPAGVPSEIENLLIKVTGNDIVKISPYEKTSLIGGSCKGDTIHSAMEAAREYWAGNPMFWNAFLAGQSIRKYRDLNDHNIYYGAGIHRAFLSFDTSSLQNKRIVSANLVMFCNSPALDNGGPNFSVRIYSGTWNYILRDFVCWNYGTDLVAQKNVNDIKAATYDVYELQPQVIHTYGKTQFRICTNREEDKIDPPEPPLSEGTCSSIDSSKILCEFVNWNPNDAWLELEVER